MAHPGVRYTRKDLDRLPPEWRAELVDGVLVMPPAPDPFHGSVVIDLAAALLRYLGPGARRRLLVAPVDVVIDDRNVLQPDVLVLPDGAQRTRPPWKIPLPVWVAEVLSPSTTDWDRGPKRRAYARAGLEELWIVDPVAEAVEVHALQRDAVRVFAAGETARSCTLDGFAVDVSALFA